MNDESLRKTGRTTRMLEQAIKMSKQFSSVYIITHNLNMAKHAKQMLINLIEDNENIKQINQFKLVYKNTEYIFQSIKSKEEIKVNHDYAVFYDHVALGIL